MIDWLNELRPDRGRNKEDGYLFLSTFHVVCKDETILAERDQILCHPPLSASLILTFSGNTENFKWLFCNKQIYIYLIALTKLIV